MMEDDDEDVHWLEAEFQHYLNRADFCHCNLPAHKCECDHMTFTEFQDAELRLMEEYWGELAYDDLQYWEELAYEDLQDRISCSI